MGGGWQIKKFKVNNLITFQSSAKFHTKDWKRRACIQAGPSYRVIKRISPFAESQRHNWRKKYHAAGSLMPTVGFR